MLLILIAYVISRLEFIGINIEGKYMAECNHCDDQGEVDCPACGGGGDYWDGEDRVLCKECNGRGICCCPYCPEGTPRKAY